MISLKMDHEKRSFLPNISHNVYINFENTMKLKVTK